MARVFLFALLVLFNFAFAITPPSFKDSFSKALPGDFIVVAQGSTYSLLLVRDITDKQLILEQVSTSSANIDLKKINWIKWIENKAPGASSWLSLTIDLEKNSLKQCFSYLERQWFFVDKSDYFLANLFGLKLRPSKDHERKRIGPAPMPGEIDRRKMWKPEMIRSGNKIKKPHYEVLRTTWPNDDTRLAGCIIELYRDAENPTFPFPYWIEVQSPHYTFKLRAIDSGKNLLSPMPKLH